MERRKKSKRKIELGDFQTPRCLARQVCALLAARRFTVASILEPTCGTGNLLCAALDQYPNVKKAIGLEINPEYVKTATTEVRRRSDATKARIIEGNFFDADWSRLLLELPDPLLVIGNPPWVTNAELGSMASSNLPRKSNFQKHSGLDALTGKSNFDISEWMLTHILELVAGRNAAIAMLCKTSVARKVLVHAWKKQIGLLSSDMYLIDAARHFGASVDACLLVCRLSRGAESTDCSVYGGLGQDNATHRIGYRDGQLIAKLALYDRWRHLQGDGVHRWRSGVKHDCAKVMELTKVASGYRNGLGELVELEDEYVFPMLKSSDVANDCTLNPERWMLVTQRAVGDETTSIKRWAPRTWNYLLEHAERLDRRASSIYRKRPRFSVFGVGPYTFAPWKIAVSGFYKALEFKTVGTVGRKPIVLDDTSYFLPFRTKSEAEYISSLLNSVTAKEFFRAFIFWDMKRPITVEVLRRLDLQALAREMGTEDIMANYISRDGLRSGPRPCLVDAQGVLFSDLVPDRGPCRSTLTKWVEKY